MKRSGRAGLPSLLARVTAPPSKELVPAGGRTHASAKPSGSVAAEPAPGSAMDRGFAPSSRGPASGRSIIVAVALGAARAHRWPHASGLRHNSASSRAPKLAAVDGREPSASIVLSPGPACPAARFPPPWRRETPVPPVQRAAAPCRVVLAASTWRSRRGGRDCYAPHPLERPPAASRISAGRVLR